MHKSKSRYKNLSIDTVAMSSVALLLLLSIVLMAKQAKWLPFNIYLPVSHSHTGDIPEENNFGVYASSGKLMIDILDSNVRKQTLRQIGAKYHTQFSREEISKFAHMGVIGVPIAGLKKYIDGYKDEHSLIGLPGIPLSSNELADWAIESKKAYQALRDRYLDVSITADAGCMYPQINQIFKALSDAKIFKFALMANQGTLIK